MTPLKATVNCDMGEADDEELMKTIHLANIACGFHASDFSIMDATVAHAKLHGVAVGAHPSLPDRQGFGRREMAIDPDELRACFVYQIGALTGFLKLHGLPLNHLLSRVHTRRSRTKGAVYGQTARSLPLARAVVTAAQTFATDAYKVAFIGLAGTAHQVACEESGVQFIPDLDYDPSGKLLITKTHAPIPMDVIRKRVTHLLETHQITTNEGGYLPLGKGVTDVSICCHSDTPTMTASIILLESVLLLPIETPGSRLSHALPWGPSAERVLKLYLSLVSCPSFYLSVRFSFSVSVSSAVSRLRSGRSLRPAAIPTHLRDAQTPSCQPRRNRRPYHEHCESRRACDALSPHVTMSDEAVSLAPQADESEAQAYLSGARVISLAREHGATMLHPGYGFLSEHADFAQAVLDAGITWLGPSPSIIRTMGLKHIARDVAGKADMPCVPGSDGLVEDEATAVQIAARVGFPIMLKASAGGGGMGMVICADEHALLDAFAGVKQRAEVLFGFGGVFLERYFPSARHIEVQIFGNGMGDIACMGERECSIPETPEDNRGNTQSLLGHSTRQVGAKLRTRMCAAAVRLGEFVKYGSAGRTSHHRSRPSRARPGKDDDSTGNSRNEGARGLASDSVEMQQTTYDSLLEQGHDRGFGCAMEARVYAENPAEQFRPCPGILQYVDIPASKHAWLRVESWISTGTTITPFFDPLLCKLVVSGATRTQVISRLQTALDESRIQGPTNNMEHLKAILANDIRDATTRFLNTFEYSPYAMTVLAAAVEMTVQDFPGRTTRLGIPRSGPMDSLAFRAANILVDNPLGAEGLEIIIFAGCPSIFQFHASAVVALTGKDIIVKVAGQDMQMWSRIIVPAGGNLSLSARPGNSSTGLRTYLAIRGGFPSIPKYLGSKSTSMGLGGFQGRSLFAGDELALARECEPKQTDAIVSRTIAPELIPVYPSHAIIHVLAGPHDDEDPNKIAWARPNGGAGGSHPSNILDNGYALGTINVNGDTPVILANEGPDMGGYVCLCTVASGELWKLGQRVLVALSNSAVFPGLMPWRWALGM
ncbi:hypothetical protein B0H17DRAFT_1129781 [Mycena rosella]|uniref:Uncharacterized protein n=1 Tax=Mycena rosella TaxID=1033263 RepID=A0AAD7GP28_MYCRO|nr:hypothetical protein B0H17DRAFT_1129781 [Mycena rosella]